MAATGLLIAFYRDRGLVAEPRRPTRFIVRHSTKVLPRAKFYDEAGTAIDLTGKTVRYILRDLTTNTLIVNRLTATNENQTTNIGEVYYQWLTAHVAAALDAIEEWEVDHGGGMTETFPVGLPQRVRIVEDVDNA